MFCIIQVTLPVFLAMGLDCFWEQGVRKTGIAGKITQVADYMERTVSLANKGYIILGD